MASFDPPLGRSPMRNISFQDLFVKPLPPAGRPQATCVYFGSSFSRAPKASAIRPAWSDGLEPGRRVKGSIGFILGEAAATTSAVATKRPTPTLRTDAHERGRFLPSVHAVGLELTGGKRSHVTPSLDSSEASLLAKRKKRKARICKEPECDKYVVDHGLCIRHGGGKRCNVEGCNCRAQNRGLCWKHGGFTICKVEGCAKRAKSRGICWSHGGGTRCKSEGCTKIAVSLGRCWAHGGGKRCAMDDCRKPASERTNNLCPEHFAWCRRDLFVAHAQCVGP